jgi:acetylornithine/succinyldiaminopimelate/putrescine aminotransferase
MSTRNPLGCAVAMTALDVLIDEQLAERAQKLGTQFRSGIHALRSPLVKEVRGRGLFNAIVIDENASRRGRTAWQFCLLLKSRGVLAKPTHVNMYVYLFVPKGIFQPVLFHEASGSRLRWSSPRRISRRPLE